MIGEKHRRGKYISYRIIVLYLVVMVLLILWSLYSFAKFYSDVVPFIFFTVPVCFIILLNFICYKWIYDPYKETEKMTNRFLDGYELSELDVYLTPSMEAEVYKIKGILNDPKMLDLNKRQAQYLALQNQINPHFLYNTLESIRSEALIASLDSVAEMTEALAIFFRYTISKVENLVSVEEELENCKTYFGIQKYRFGNRIHLEIEYEEDEWQDICHYRIPKLTLQPILENSIIHGTELKLGTSTLKIHFQCTEKRLIIRVSDDGIGMSEEKLWKLNKKLRMNDARDTYQDESKGGIALVNVNNRIHLLFGEEYGMHVYSIEGVGTDVEISIPAIISDKEVANREVF